MSTEQVGTLIHDTELLASCRVVGVHMLLCPQPQTAVQLSKDLGMDRLTVTNALKTLEPRGLVSKDQNGLWIGKPSEPAE
ncbi:helix-turn-helix domain-containing protein [Streptomyces sp. PanSC9]|uniref:helix-turn-helix domain-containing protein n=1 Tax=Streptomyces sp. PanSC9 TaxID=1520461 RepID=UPI000F470FB6|nr:helix-turn-helix domain-containing protein [Streptomyces sp. PanSC9]ROP53301.1 MarR family protein [Streptomyces sp. PanSC9]